MSLHTSLLIIALSVPVAATLLVVTANFLNRETCIPSGLRRIYHWFIAATIVTLTLWVSSAVADETSVTFGLYTEHYQNDSPELNEDNRLVQLSHVSNGYLLTGSTFVNSHRQRTYAFGGGIAHDNMGFAIIAVHGYDGYLRQHYGEIMFAPMAHYLYNVNENHSLKLNLVPTVVNLGYDYRF